MPPVSDSSSRETPLAQKLAFIALMIAPARRPLRRSLSNTDDAVSYTRGTLSKVTDSLAWVAMRIAVTASAHAFQPFASGGFVVSGSIGLKVKIVPEVHRSPARPCASRAGAKNKG
jgi:hypothetical protein